MKNDDFVKTHFSNSNVIEKTNQKPTKEVEKPHVVLLDSDPSNLVLLKYHNVYLHYLNNI